LRGLDLALVYALDACTADCAQLLDRAEEICSLLRPDSGPGQLTAEAFARAINAAQRELEEVGLAIAKHYEALGAEIAGIAEVEQGVTVEHVKRFRDHASDRLSILFDAGHGKQERLQVWVANGRIGFEDADRLRIQGQLRKAHEADLLAQASAYRRGVEAGSGLNSLGTIDPDAAARIGSEIAVAAPGREPMTVLKWSEMVAERVSREGTGCSRVFDLSIRDVRDLAAEARIVAWPQPSSAWSAVAAVLEAAREGDLISFAGQQIRVVPVAAEVQP
jgi:hypothetical protein